MKLKEACMDMLTDFALMDATEKRKVLIGMAIGILVFFTLYTYVILGLGYMWGSAIQEQVMLDQIAIREMNISRLVYAPAKAMTPFGWENATRIGYFNQT